ncbi:MAG: phosphohydrolase [Melioribacteraceae bacterium]
MKQINIAIDLANRVHSGQLDKGGQPYIFHPLRVASKFKDEKYRIVAILHDILEDGGEINDVSYNFSNYILNAILAITRKENESYMDFIKRVSENEIARAVKIEDLKDNLDLSRLDGKATSEDIKRCMKYQKALEYLVKVKVKILINNSLS